MAALSRYRARVEVRHRPGILDPQGAAVARSLPALGYDNVSEVEVGKLIRLSVEAPGPEEARAQVLEMCRRLLANPVLEDFAVEIVDGEPAEGEG